MTGVGTVMQDDPRMTVRLAQVDKQPLRVVVDSNLRMSADRKMLSEPGETLVFTCQTNANLNNVELVTVASTQGRVDLGAVLDELGKREINEVHLERGIDG